MGDISKDVQSTFVSEKVKAIINIKYTAHWIEQLGLSILKPYDLSEQQYNVLRILRGAGQRVMVNKVRERMIQKSPNITRLMDKMCQKNLIKRTRCDEDRRVVYVEITARGLQLLDEVNIEALHNQVNDLSDAEFELLNKLLDKLR